MQSETELGTCLVRNKVWRRTYLIRSGCHRSSLAAKSGDTDSFPPAASRMVAFDVLGFDTQLPGHATHWWPEFNVQSPIQPRSFDIEIQLEDPTPRCRAFGCLCNVAPICSKLCNHRRQARRSLDVFGARHAEMDPTRIKSIDHLGASFGPAFRHALA